MKTYVTRPVLSLRARKLASGCKETFEVWDEDTAVAPVRESLHLELC